eukprot:UN06698
MSQLSLAIFIASTNMDLIWGLINVPLSKKRPQNLETHESCHIALADGMIFKNTYNCTILIFQYNTISL